MAARELTNYEIDFLSHRKGVETTVVENFLTTMPLEIGPIHNRANAFKKMALYKWNKPTFDAVLLGIDIAFTGKVVRPLKKYKLEKGVA